MSIRHINHGSTPGYRVRVGPRHASMTKFFAVRNHGGMRKALAPARAVAAELPKIAEPTPPRKGARVVAQANDTSGLIGIRPRYVLFAAHPCPYFIASCRIDGTARSTGFLRSATSSWAALTEHPPRAVTHCTLEGAPGSGAAPAVRSALHTAAHRSIAYRWNP